MMREKLSNDHEDNRFKSFMPWQQPPPFYSIAHVWSERIHMFQKVLCPFISLMAPCQWPLGTIDGEIDPYRNAGITQGFRRHSSSGQPSVSSSACVSSGVAEADAT